MYDVRKYRGCSKVSSGSVYTGSGTFSSMGYVTSAFILAFVRHETLPSTMVLVNMQSDQVYSHLFRKLVAFRIGTFMEIDRRWRTFSFCGSARPYCMPLDSKIARKYDQRVATESICIYYFPRKFCISSSWNQSLQLHGSIIKRYIHV